MKFIKFHFAKFTKKNFSQLSRDCHRVEKKIENMREKLSLN